MNEKAYARHRKYYEKNREKCIERAKLWKQARRVPKEYEYLSNTEKSYKRMSINPVGHLLSRAKTRAKKKGLLFDIEPEDVVFPEVCPYLGIPLQFNKGSPQDNSYALDRIDNTKGYVKGNVQVISHKANNMKRDATLTELLLFARAVLEMLDVPDV